MTQSAEAEVERQRSPYPSLDVMHSGMWEMLKSAKSIELEVERLVVVPLNQRKIYGESGIHPRTTQRPFRPEERNWSVEFDEADIAGSGHTKKWTSNVSDRVDEEDSGSLRSRRSTVQST